MKVTYFLGEFPVKTETFVINQIAGLISQGADVSIISISKGDMDCDHPALIKYNLLSRCRFLLSEERSDSQSKRNIRRLKDIFRTYKFFRIFKAMFSFRKLGKYGRSLKFLAAASGIDKPISSDVFVCHFGFIGVFAHRLRQLGVIRGKIATVFHGYDMSQADLLARHKQDYISLFEQTEAMLPISEHWKDKLIDLGCAEEKIFVNRMGINLDDFVSREFGRKLNVPIKIVSVARFVEKKGIEYALKSMHVLKNRGVDFVYKIIGDGPLKENYELLINKYGLNDEVHLLGYIPQEGVKKLLDDSDLFLLPSVTASCGDKEGIPVSLMEAMAVGLITVSTNHSGIPELIDDGVDGFLANERDSEALADILCEINGNKFDLEELRRKSLLKISTKFNQKSLYEELFLISKNIYEN
ncbi:glycosyltransferase [Corallincola holothuriorum]|uniref:Glycosyltransferase n=1 Tax=Corallincola holothuriorum TaxID=2282215 RepID=A0A368NJC5_9GAMM|nr:glycosyltransferase [Corallincola holothuriorum]RCU49461.1 glycosyltransferase [Corallincola holothuriorum]